MNEEKINSGVTEQAEAYEEKAPVELSKQEGKNKAEELPKLNKRSERLAGLKEKYEKAVSAQSAAEKKTKDISAQIAKIEREIHAEEDSSLAGTCKAVGCTYPEIEEFLKGIPKGMTLTEVLKKLK